MASTNAASPDTTNKRNSAVGARGRSPNHQASPSNSAPANSNVARTRSVKTTTGSPLSAKGAARRPTVVSKPGVDGSSDDTKAEQTAIIEDLREQLRKAETASDEHQKQVFVLQSRLDETLSDHTRLEESSNAHVEKLDSLEKEKQDTLRRHRDLQTSFEAEKAASMREREEASAREEELNGIVQRLKDSLAQREQSKAAEGEGMLARNASFRGRSSPSIPDSPVRDGRDNSQSNSKLILQKDKVIESLRLELAEAQIKLVELENAGGGHLQELEKMLLEARMSNAKLLEDNESYQMLLSEKTLNGDLTKNSLFETSTNHSERSEVPITPSTARGGSNLADELSTADTDAPDEHTKKIEAELGALKDQNKALTLYINKIITKMLATESFEKLFDTGLSSADPPAPPSTGTSKPLPREPRESKESKESNSSDGKSSDTSAAPHTATSSLLQRAGSLFGGRQKQRPKSLNPAAEESPQSAPLPAQSTQTPPTTGQHLTAPNQDPATAPSLPIRRSYSGRGGNRASGIRGGHRRTSSDWSSRMYIATPPAPGTSNSPPALASPRSTSGGFFNGGGGSAPPPLILEDQEKADTSGLRSDVASDSGYGDSIDMPSSPRAAAAAALEGRAPSYTRTDTSHSNPDSRGATQAAPGAAGGSGGGWFSSMGAAKAPEKNQMRPLRLVQEKESEDAAARAEMKKANRTSFMGWFNKGGPPNANANASANAASSPPQAGGLHARTPSSVPIGLGIPLEGHARSVSSVAPSGPSLGLPVGDAAHTRAVSSGAVSSGALGLSRAPLEPVEASPVVGGPETEEPGVTTSPPPGE